MSKILKKETAEEIEINAIAKKISETNKKILKSLPQPQPQQQGPKIMARPGQPNIMQFCTKNNNKTPILEPLKEDPKMNTEIDEESKKGRFGWTELDKQYVPYIFRYGTIKYLSVRIVEKKILTRLLQLLPPEVKSCTSISSYYLTEPEAKLLNEINIFHTNKNEFGKEKFTTKDLLVSLEDVQEFFNFLELCHKKVVLKKSTSSDRCGFLRIDGESVVPFTIRNNLKFVPLFYFEGETADLKLTSQEIAGWDLAYIKFCCKVQKIRNELFDKETCKIVNLEEIKSHFSEETTYEDYWPAKGGIEPLPVKNARSKTFQSQTWTHKPALQLTKQQAATLVIKQQNKINQPSSAPQQTQPFQQVPTIQTNRPNKPFPGKLEQIMEFPVEPNPGQEPYKMQKVLIHQKLVSCINVKPNDYTRLMVTFPDILDNFCPQATVDSCRNVVQDVLKLTMYKGNLLQGQVLFKQGKCAMFDPVPLVEVNDLISHVPTIVSMFPPKLVTPAPAIAAPPSKRVRVG